MYFLFYFIIQFLTNEYRNYKHSSSAKEPIEPWPHI